MYNIYIYWVKFPNKIPEEVSYNPLFILNIISNGEQQCL